MRWTTRYIVFWLSAIAVLMSSDVVAQIRIVPIEKIDSIAKPKTVATDAVVIDGGNVVSFGEIAEDGGVWQSSVKWTNKSDKPIVVTRITTSCSCLRVESERKPIEGGKQGDIVIRYSPERRSGRINQRAFVYTNLSDKLPTAVITVSGYVKRSADRSKDYPYSRGALLLRRDTVDVVRGEVASIACMNSGTKALRLRTDTLFTERGIELYTEPEVLEAGGCGRLMISVPHNLTSKACVKACVSGLPLPPRQRTIVLRVKE